MFTISYFCWNVCEFDYFVLTSKENIYKSIESGNGCWFKFWLHPRNKNPKVWCVETVSWKRYTFVIEISHRREYGFRLFLDLENIKKDVDKATAKCITFEVFQITQIASNFMHYWFQMRDFFVLDTTIVGCWE